jgi:RNA polymerase sigma factor (sigma-70 family)
MDALTRITQASAAVQPSKEPLLGMAEIVQRYEGLLRQMARAKLSPSLRRLGDSVDFSQTVFLSFFKQVGTGNFVPEGSAHVRAFLSTMAAHKIADLYRGKPARESKNVSIDSARSFDVVDPKMDDPARAVETCDLYDALRRQMSKSERLLYDLRDAGLGWAEIAQRMGGTHAARMMQHRRLLLRLKSSVIGAGTTPTAAGSSSAASRSG